MNAASSSARREPWRQAAPALAVGAGIFLLALLRTGSPGLAATVGGLATLFLGPPAWVWWDAQRLGLRHPVAWGVFALLTTPVGAVIYYLLRPGPSSQRSCASCRRDVDAGFSACPWCGTPCAAEDAESCPDCHAAVDADWAFCPYCRRRLGGGDASISA